MRVGPLLLLLHVVVAVLAGVDAACRRAGEGGVELSSKEGSDAARPGTPGIALDLAAFLPGEHAGVNTTGPKAVKGQCFNRPFR